MKNHGAIEKTLEKRYRARDRKKRQRMKVSGKSVFTLQRLISENPPPKKILKLPRKPGRSKG